MEDMNDMDVEERDVEMEMDEPLTHDTRSVVAAKAVEIPSKPAQPDPVIVNPFPYAEPRPSVSRPDPVVTLNPTYTSPRPFVMKADPVIANSAHYEQGPSGPNVNSARIPRPHLTQEVSVPHSNDVPINAHGSAQEHDYGSAQEQFIRKQIVNQYR
jgi:hypothetical protein